MNFLAVSLLLFFISAATAQSDQAAKYLHNLAQVQLSARNLETDFEYLKQTNVKDAKKLNETMERIKYNKEQIMKDRAEITSLLSTMSSYVITDKIYLELARIMYNSYEDALNEIGFELLAQQAGVYEFKPTYVSESLDMQMAMVKQQLQSVINMLVDVDQRMNSIMSHTHPEYDLYNVLRLLSELSKVITDVSNFKVKILTVYTDELDHANRAESKLSLLQKAEIDSHIVMGNWIIQFSRTYQLLVEKFIAQKDSKY